MTDHAEPEPPTVAVKFGVMVKVTERSRWHNGGPGLLKHLVAQDPRDAERVLVAAISQALARLDIEVLRAVETERM